MMQRVIQLLPTVSFGDAVSNDALALHRVLTGAGYHAAVYAENIDPRLRRCAVRPVSDMVLHPEDVLLYHMSTGTDLNERLPELRCIKIMLYHNITPPEFFRPYDLKAAARTAYGMHAVKRLRNVFDLCLADSAYDLSELRRFGYTCPMAVRPVLIPFEDYRKKPDAAFLRRLTADGRANLLFVGRIAPNKRQEDLIRTFYCFQQRNPHSRLILAGSWTGMEHYYHRLESYVRMLDLPDVQFTGRLSFPQLLACYHAADVFLCMSEHEGFCVPLTEAMYFGVPIVARRCGAVPDTLGGSGLLTDKNDPMETALLTERLLTDSSLRCAVIAGEKQRLEDFSYEKTRELFLGQLRTLLRKKGLTA